MKKRTIKDKILNTITYIFSSFGVLILILIFVYIFSNGIKLLSFNLLKDDYYSKSYTVKYLEDYHGNFMYNSKENEYFSSNWGIAFIDTTSTEGNKVVKISYIDEYSPLNNMIDASNNQYISLKKGQVINKGVLVGSGDEIITIGSKDTAKMIASKFNNAIKFTNLSISIGGGGIRGSLIATILLIVITLIIAIPIGSCAAIYLSIYAKKNKFTTTLETMIDMIGGIPSIIFGLVGVIVFIPTLNKIIKSDGASLMAGALTLAIMLLPIIIKTTSESINTIPKSLQEASLALGASQTQTTFKIILPNAIPGILTSILLCIGRIIGESAALIFVTGSQIMDKISIKSKGTTLSTHIWNLLGGENPNYNLACTISIVILTVVLVLNIIVKLVGKKLNKFERI